jgi:hypothetical protein
MNGVKSQLPDPPARSTAQVSGKLVIIVILAITLGAAATSWWFRYTATHRAAKFWGPEAAMLIRDARIVELDTIEPAIDSKRRTVVQLGIDNRGEPRSISTAHGLTHLRNALLEDRSFDWSQQFHTTSSPWRWVLMFRNDETVVLALLFTSDCKHVAPVKAIDKAVSCEPIAAGLREMFEEFSSQSPSEKKDR